MLQAGFPLGEFFFVPQSPEMRIEGGEKLSHLKKNIYIYYIRRRSLFLEVEEGEERDGQANPFQQDIIFPIMY